MKTNHYRYWMCMILWCMAMVLMISRMAIPWLAKGTAHMHGDLLGPDQPDIQAIRAPRPPLPLANNEPGVTGTPALPLAAAQLSEAIPVPTPPTQVALPDSPVAPNSVSGAAPQPSIPVVSSRGAIAGSVMFILLLILMWWRRASGFRSLHQECAS